MAVTVIDLKSALILVGLEGLAIEPPISPEASEVAANVRGLMASYRELGLPVILVTRAAGPNRRTEHRPAATATSTGNPLDVAPSDPAGGDRALTTLAWSAFEQTGLEDHLRGLGVTQVVIAGTTTSGGVESTCRQAFDLGFNVLVAIDAVADLSAEAHEHSIQHIFPKLGERGVTLEIMSLLDPDP